MDSLGDESLECMLKEIYPYRLDLFSWLPFRTNSEWMEIPRWCAEQFGENAVIYNANGDRRITVDGSRAWALSDCWVLYLRDEKDAVYFKLRWG